MIERRGNVSYSVIVQDQKGRPFPEISKNGVTYVVARPGEEFRVKVERIVTSTTKNAVYHSAGLKIDGHGIGYLGDLCEDKMNSLASSCTFMGWRIDHLTKRAFAFSQPEVVEEDEKKPFKAAVESKVGSLEVYLCEMETYKCQAPEKDCRECAFKGHGGNVKVREVKKPSSVGQADSKKFFYAPSLTTKGGCVISRPPPKRQNSHLRRKAGGPEIQMKLRFETAPILLLRGVLERSNLEHAKLLEDVHQVLIPEEEKGSSIKENKRSIVKSEANKGSSSRGVVKIGAVKREPLGDPEKRKRLQETRSIPTGAIKTESVKKEIVGVTKETRGPRAERPVPTMIETVDLTEDDGIDQDCMMYTVSKKPRPTDLLYLD